MDKDAFLKYVFHNVCIHSGEEDSSSLHPGIYRRAGEKPFFILWEISIEHSEIKAASADNGVVTVSHFPVSAGQKTLTHQHDAIELLYVLEGNFSQNIAGTDCLFPPDSIVFINRNVLHYDIIQESAVILFLSIPNTLMENQFRNNKYSPYQNFISNLMFQSGGEYSHLHGLPKAAASIDTDTQIAIPLAQIAHEIAGPSPGSSYITKGYLIRLFYNLVTDYQFHLSGYARSDMRKLLFQEIEADIRRNCRDITIQFLQNKYHFNRDYFNRLIQESCGLTFRELRKQLRLEEAQRLLLETDLNIEQISLAVGYENQGYFYKQFYEKFEKTPRQYRLSKKS